MRWISLAIFGMVCCGCGSAENGAKLANVSGKVTLNGHPAVAEITFQPHDEDTQGRPSRGFSDSEGQFELQYSASELGAVVGRHQVVITVQSRSGSHKATGGALRQAAKTARLIREVRPGDNEFHFALTY